MSGRSGNLINQGFVTQYYEHDWGTYGASRTNIPPSSGTHFFIGQANSICVQADTTDGTNASASVDINVITSPDGTTWDVTPYAEFNIADAIIKTVSVTPGPKWMRLRSDNNGSADALLHTKTFVRF